MLIGLSRLFVNFRVNFNPPFGSGVQLGRIADIFGQIGETAYGIYVEGGNIDATGAFKGYYTSGYRYGGPGASSSTIYDFAASRVVPTGPDVAGTNISMREWRRVA